MMKFFDKLQRLSVIQKRRFAGLFYYKLTFSRIETISASVSR